MLAAWAVAAWAGSRAELTAQLDRLQDDPFLHGASLGSLVQDVTTGEAYFSRAADKLLLPASTAKLGTAAAAFDGLGSKFRFTTRVEAGGAIQSGVLRGPLVVSGSGDPTFGENDPVAALGALADAVKARGITRIDGDIVVDDRVYAWRPLGDGWSWDDALWRSGAPVAGFNLGHNTVTLTVSPGATFGAPARVEAEALAWCVPLTVDVQTGAPGSPDTLTVDRPPASSVTAFWGTIPADAAPRKLTITIPDPPACAAEGLRRALVERNVTVSGAARRAVRAETFATSRIHETSSAPLGDLLAAMLKESDNLYAEAIFRALDPAPIGKTPAEAAKRVMDVYRAAGVPDDAVLIMDGSGLSRKDLVSAEALVRLLRWAWDRPWREAWYAALPVAATDGTLKRRMIGGPAVGHVHAKTGTLANVYNLAGYVESRDGRTLAFAFVSNAVIAAGSAARLPQDTALEVLANTDFSLLPPPTAPVKVRRRR